jgi:hypothetical protein
MSGSLKAAGVVLGAALVAPLAGQAKVIKAMGGTFQLEKKMMLACLVNNAHRVEVGSARPGIRKGTLISFTAKLDYPPYKLYAATIPLPEDIPAHLFVPLTTYYPTIPKFCIACGCEAWWTRPPPVAPPQ